MPRIKTQHKDVLRDGDVKKMLDLATLLEASNRPAIYRFKDEKGKDQTEELTIHYGMVKALICFLYLFGKRVTEVLQLRRGDLWSKRGFLYVRFHVLKKKRRTDLALPQMKVKRVSIRRQKPFIMPIVDYATTLNDMNMPLFPGKCRPHTQIVKRKDKEGRIIKVYEYKIKREGIMSRVQAYKILKSLDVGAYPHWFRHSLATQLAEEGFTPWELKEWFDWSRFQTAVNYVEGTPSMTERISKRKVG